MELAFRQVAAPLRNEAEDRPAVELVDHVHRAVRADRYPLVALDADLPALLDA
jgi:hypothetical protein